MGVVKYSGPIASFHCPTNAEIRSLKVHFSPKQLGEGTPSPENVREIEGWDGVKVEHTKNNLAQFEPYGTGGINLKWSVPKSILETDCLIRYSIYIDNSNGNSEACIRAAFFNINGNRLQSRTRASGVPVGQSERDYFTIQPIPSETDYIVFGIKGSNFSIKEPMIDIFQNNAFKERPYEPYHGSTTNYEFGVLGKNKFNKDAVTDYCRINGSGEITAQSGMSISDYIEVIPNQTYTITTTGDISGNKRHAYYDINKEYLGVFPSSSTTITIPENARYIRLTLYNNALDTTQLELGSTATAYEPYNPNKTIYGGWVDLISGEVQEDGIDGYPYCSIVLQGTEEWTLVKQDDEASIFKYCYGIGAKTESKSICSHFQMILPSYTALSCHNGFVHGMSGNLFIQPITSTASTVEEFKSYLASQYQNGTPVTVLFQANKTPNTYHLAPTQLQTFLGANNVWSNANYVEVEYDLHETQNILARKQFIIANQPHVEKLAAAPLQNFITDMAAPLKECKVGFEPVQEGTGDPSPENVRPISGWTGLSLYHSGENLYIPNPDNKGYINVRGEINVDTTSTYTDLIPVTAGETYSFKCTTVSVPGGTTNRRLHGYDSNGNWVLQITNRTTAAATVEDVSIVVTIPSDVSYIRVSFRNQDTNVRIAKEDVIGVNWETEAGTVYGGYVDLVTGEVWKTYIFYALKDLTPVTYGASSYDGMLGTNAMYYIADSTISHPTNINTSFSDKVQWAGDSTWSNPDNYIWKYGINARNQLHVVFDNATVGITQDMSFSTRRTTIKNWLQNNNINFAIPLLTPQLITTLTPTQLKTLRGTNNIWSNANGPVEVQYWTH